MRAGAESGGLKLGRKARTRIKAAKALASMSIQRGRGKNIEREEIPMGLVALGHIKAGVNEVATTLKSHLMACQNLKQGKSKVIANLSLGRVEVDQVLHPLHQHLVVTAVEETAQKGAIGDTVSVRHPLVKGRCHQTTTRIIRRKTGIDVPLGEQIR